jgi:hypothetical protein
VAWLEVDGLHDEIVAEAGFGHTNNGVIIDLVRAAGVVGGLDRAGFVVRGLSLKNAGGDKENECQDGRETARHATRREHGSEFNTFLGLGSRGEPLTSEIEKPSGGEP